MDILILASTMAVLIVFERAQSLRFEALPVLRRYAATDVFYLLTSGIALSLAAQSLAVRFVAPASGFAVTSGLAVASFILFDLGAYVSHRFLHRFDILWKVHKVHHSSHHLDWLATFRGHLAEHAIRQLFSPVLLIALGVPLVIVGLTAAVHGAWSAFVHSNFGPRLRFLDPIVITPRLHRVHHVAASCERNFGVVFSIWDRLAGTLSTATEGDGILGVPGEVDTYPQTWTVQLWEPFRRRRSRSPVASIASVAAGR
jgi:sterol desaturase/sphingolipid hydroxylase (fatty acid hydroxylase superfamily)